MARRPWAAFVSFGSHDLYPLKAAHDSGSERLGKTGKNSSPVSSSFSSSLTNAGWLAGGGDLFAAGFTAELVVTRDGAVAS